MIKLHVGPLTRARLLQEVASVADGLARSGAHSVRVTFAFGADPEPPLFGVPVSVAATDLPAYVGGLEDQGVCRLGESNITVKAAPGGAATGAEVVFANDMDIYFFGEVGPLVSELHDRWASCPNDAAGDEGGPHHRTSGP